MSKTSSRGRRPSITGLTWARRLRVSWTRWSLTRTVRRLRLEEHRLRLMQESVDSQHLRIKGLETRRWLLETQQQELLEIHNFRVRKHLPELPPPPEKEILDQLLGQ